VDEIKKQGSKKIREEGERKDTKAETEINRERAKQRKKTIKGMENKYE
jgi:hypothetical protein